MTVYASTFPSGLQDVVKELLESTFSSIQFLHVLDGMIVYQGKIPAGEVIKLRFLNNSFIMIKEFADLPGGVQQMLNEVGNDRSLKTWIASSCLFTKAQTSFRIVVSEENQSIAINPRLRARVEEAIAASTHLSVNRTKPKTEFWFLQRSEGMGFFLQRLTSHTAYEQVLEKGQLKPEICYMLCTLSEPQASDIFLDPFCGFGSIPFERAASFPYNMIYAIDQDPDKKIFIRGQLKKMKTKAPFIVKTQDALHLDGFEDGFIDKIVTDPPWGLYEKGSVANLEDFYTRMLHEFVRILKPGGLIVVLTAGKFEFEQAQKTVQERLSTLAKYDVLISGKKASIYKLKKIA